MRPGWVAHRHPPPGDVSVVKTDRSPIGSWKRRTADPSSTMQVPDRPPRPVVQPTAASASGVVASRSRYRPMIRRFVVPGLGRGQQIAEEGHGAAAADRLGHGQVGNAHTRIAPRTSACCQPGAGSTNRGPRMNWRRKRSFSSGYFDGWLIAGNVLPGVKNSKTRRPAPERRSAWTVARSASASPRRFSMERTGVADARDAEARAESGRRGGVIAGSPGRTFLPRIHRRTSVEDLPLLGECLSSGSAPKATRPGRHLHARPFDAETPQDTFLSTPWLANPGTSS